jgi:hypothetical protein
MLCEKIVAIYSLRAFAVTSYHKGDQLLMLSTTTTPE